MLFHSISPSPSSFLFCLLYLSLHSSTREHWSTHSSHSHCNNYTHKLAAMFSFQKSLQKIQPNAKTIVKCVRSTRRHVQTDDTNHVASNQILTIAPIKSFCVWHTAEPNYAFVFRACTDVCYTQSAFDYSVRTKIKYAIHLPFQWHPPCSFWWTLCDYLIVFQIYCL